MKGLRAIYRFFSLAITLPIWLYLLHYLLAAAHPDRLVWFLFWVYFPLSFFIAIVAQILDGLALDERFDAWVRKKGGAK